MGAFVRTGYVAQNQIAIIGAPSLPLIKKEICAILPSLQTIAGKPWLFGSVS